MSDLGHNRNIEYITGDQLVEWQSNSIDTIASLNVAYLQTTITVIAIIFAVLQLVAYKISNKRFKELENKIKSDTTKDIANIEKKLVKDILGPPRINELVKINDAIFLVTQNGKIGFTNEQALRAFGYESSSAILANPSERDLPELNSISEKKVGFKTPQDQIFSESNKENLGVKSGS